MKNRRLQIYCMALAGLSELYVHPVASEDGTMGANQRWRLRLVRPAMDRILLHVLHVHTSAKPHEQVLEISPGGPAHGFLLWAGEVSETLDKFPVTFAELVGTGPGS